MYDYIKGELAYADMKQAVIDCNGVGYKCFISLNTYKKITGKTSVKLMTYLNVKEDAMDLYGFADVEEREFFLLLLGVNGVGPKAALAVLSDLSASEFASVLATNDAKRLTKVPSIGTKTAQRICLELKDKIAGSAFSASGADIEEIRETFSDAKTEAVEALVTLGYSKTEARNAVLRCPAENTNDLIKQALRLLSSSL